MPAQLITFPYPTDNSCTINIDFKGNEYLLRWDGDWRILPDLAKFPLVTNASASPIPHSQYIHALWTTSQVLTHGTDSHIRTLDSCSDGFPICKVAINGRQRRLLGEEFALLRRLSTSDGVPVVQTHPALLVDEQGGVFGFRMERLVEIDLERAAEYAAEIGRALEEVHRCGVAHGDISPSNLMLDHRGRVTVIDFGQAGYVGQEVPAHKTKDMGPKRKEVFSFESDDDDLKRVNGMSVNFGEGLNSKTQLGSRLLDIFVRKGYCS